MGYADAAYTPLPYHAPYLPKWLVSLRYVPNGVRMLPCVWYASTAVPSASSFPLYLN